MAMSELMSRWFHQPRQLALALVVVMTAGCGGSTAPATPTGSPALTPAASEPAAATDGGTAAPATATPASTAPVATPPPTEGASPEPEPEPSAPEASLTPTAWRELAAGGEVPGPREDHTWTLDPAGDSAYLFGGRNRGDASDELWRYDLAAGTWTRLAAAGAPPARFGHVAVWAEGVGLVIWSGQVGSTFFSDIWAYDPAADAWRELAATGDVPPARYGSCGGIGPDGRLWISHGFTADQGRFSDTRAYDFSSDSWADVTVDGRRPVERCLHDCLWTADGRLLVYAGQTTGVPAIGDLWALDPQAATWTRADGPEPPARQLYALASVGDSAFVFGGGSEDQQMLNDLWRLDLAELTWSQPQLSGSGPSARAGATLLADPARSRLLLFGGTTGDAELNDLWELSLDLP